MEFSMMEGISEHHRREVGVNLTGGKTNAVEICEKILSAPSLDDMLAEFQKEKGLPVDPPSRHVEGYTTARKRVEVEEELRDDSVMED